MGTTRQTIRELFKRADASRLPLLDLLPEGGVEEKLLSLALSGPPRLAPSAISPLVELAEHLNSLPTAMVRVVVFGGGTGLSNLIGGDSRQPGWVDDPFSGLKALFPRLTSVVCVTDDGGSSGELLKDLSFIALGDLRHVLLSSIQAERLEKLYNLSQAETVEVAHQLHRLFNHRFAGRPGSPRELLAATKAHLDLLPEYLSRTLTLLVEELFLNPELGRTLSRPHCLGNLILAAAISQQAKGRTPGAKDVVAGLGFLAEIIGAPRQGVLPCTTTPARLQVLYANGVMATGEEKSSRAHRRSPVDRVFTVFSGEPVLPPQVERAVDEADLILFAPGSLYTSIVPVLQVPGLADRIRANGKALKVLFANLWAQAGETDVSREDQRRRFRVSDTLLAYHRNIPGGVHDLFDRVLVMGLREIPGSILQNYALENKLPIYLDRDRVEELGFMAIEAGLASARDMETRRVVQHDPATVAAAVRVLWGIRELLQGEKRRPVGPPPSSTPSWRITSRGDTQAARFRAVEERLRGLAMDEGTRELFAELLWEHADIPVEHLDHLQGVEIVPAASWRRSQEWDNVYAFFDPADRFVRVREDVTGDRMRFATGILVGLGQSLLGDYAAAKEKIPLTHQGEEVGFLFRLTVNRARCSCWFDDQGLSRYLTLARLRPLHADPMVFTRVVNREEGFTPPGLLFGLTYAWYLDNRYADPIEYKMTVIQTVVSDLLPEQKKLSRRRRELVDFFRTRVFLQMLPGEK